MEGFQKKLQDMLRARHEEIDHLNSQLTRLKIHFNRKQRIIDDLQAALKTQELNEKHITTFEADKEDMTQCYKQLIEKYEQVRKALIVAEAKVMSEHDSMTSRQEELKNEISALKYRFSMGEKKVHSILN